ncbi:hypothetical protein NDI39_03860 [Microcoleus sp. ZQ-A2]|nr:hypothetical protein [Microcoleus sp. FACHB-1]
MYPVHWRNYPNTVPLTWKQVKFTSANASQIPDDKTGVYSFVADAGIAQHPAGCYLLYVGKVKDQNLRTRYRQYLRAETAWKNRPHIAQMISKWSEHLWFYYAEISDPKIINQLEEDLITAFLPPENRSWPAKITHIMRMVF